MKRLIGFKPNLRALIPEGLKTETMRTNKRWLKVKKGDELWVKGKGMMSGWKDAIMVLVATKNAKLVRLNDMTEKNARAEGVGEFGIPGFCPEWLDAKHGVMCFSQLWNSINKKKPKRWEDNPEVVRLTFRFDRLLK